MNYSLLRFVYFLTLILSFTPVEIAQASVIISEVYPNPLTGESEWIELYNTSTESANLSNWQLKDVLSTPSIAYQFSATDSIAGLSYLAVDLATQKLNNAADGVRLYNNSNELIDSMDYTSSSVGMSWSLVASSWQQVTPSRGTANPTPNPSPSPTPFPTPTSTPSPSPNIEYPISDIQVVSFSPCPETGIQEFIEIKNTNNQQITINDWKIIDKDDNYKTISGTLPSQQATRIAWAGSLLNNAGDQFSLMTDQQSQVTRIEYGECQKGKPFVHLNGEWTQESEDRTYTQTGVTLSVASKSASPVSNQQILGSISTDSPRSNPATYARLQSLATAPTDVHISVPMTEKKKAKPPYIQPAVEPSKAGVISVIMGGSIISVSGLLPLYEKLRQLKTQILD